MVKLTKGNRIFFSVSICSTRKLRKTHVLGLQVLNEEGCGERLQAVRSDTSGERGEPEPVQEARLSQALYDRAHDFRA